MKLTMCDVCGEKINEEFRGTRLGKEPAVIGIPDYIVERKHDGDPEGITPYDTCWDCQDRIHRAAFECIEMIKTKKKKRPKPKPELFGVGHTLEGMNIHDKINARAGDVK